MKYHGLKLSKALRNASLGEKHSIAFFKSISLVAKSLKGRNLFVENILRHFHSLYFFKQSFLTKVSLVHYLESSDERKIEFLIFKTVSSVPKQVNQFAFRQLFSSNNSAFWNLKFNENISFSSFNVEVYKSKGRMSIFRQCLKHLTSLFC